jgi:cysteine desulfurase
MKQIYLDYNATTPIAPSVLEAIQPFLTRHYGNPSSSHAAGRAASEAIEDARTQVAGLLGVGREAIVFTSGGTESNNFAIKGAMYAARAPGHMVISAIEHPAVTRPARFMEQIGHELTVVRCGRDGVVDPDDVRRAIRPDTRLVSVMHSNNEIGTLQPIAEIAWICRDRGVLFHTDASQSVGKVPTRCEDLGVDLLTIAGHKLYAPKGIGALYIREGVDLEPLLHGGDQEDGFRGGTENTPWIVGLGQACHMVAGCLDQTMERLAELRDLLHEEIESAAGCPIPINGGSAPRLPNTLSLRMPGVPGHVVLRGCPEVAASTGSACHSEHHDMSPVLAALGLEAREASETIRLSVGWYTSEDDIAVAANALVSAWQSARQARA